MQFNNYVRVQSLEEAYALNQKKNNVIVGGMHWLKMMDRPKGTAIDLSGLGLDAIAETEDAFEIGCMVSLRQLETHAGLNAYTMGAVKDAVKDIVGVQFRNTATVGGSLFGRYGFSDVLTVFLAMDCYVECFHAGVIPLAEFAEKPYDRDILVKLIVKKTPLRMAYMAQRHARTDFPILTCACARVDGSWRVSIGARPMKAALVTDPGLMAGPVTEAAATALGTYAANALTFGSNNRGSADYRKQIAPVLVKRAVLAAAKED